MAPFANIQWVQNGRDFKSCSLTCAFSTHWYTYVIYTYIYVINALIASTQHWGYAHFNRLDNFFADCTYEKLEGSSLLAISTISSVLVDWHLDSVDRNCNKSRLKWHCSVQPGETAQRTWKSNSGSFCASTIDKKLSCILSSLVLPAGFRQK